MIHTKKILTFIFIVGAFFQAKSALADDTDTAQRNAQLVVEVGPILPPPPVYVQPAPPPPPPVYVQPAPPPVVYVQPTPPPPPVYVQPAPPPVVYQQPYPQQYQQPVPPPSVMVMPAYGQQPAFNQRFGLHGFLGAAGANNMGFGGIGGALRIRPTPRYAFDLGVAAFGGRDWHGLNRIELPVTVDALAFLNTQRRAQFYVVGGVGVSWAAIQTTEFDPLEQRFAYFGGQAGIGVEWRVSPRFAVNADIRGFIRTRVDSTEPEFVDLETGKTTNLSGGALMQFGSTVYF